MEVITELWHEIVHEVTHESTTLIIELVQFAILIFVIKAVAFGLGKRTGMLPGMLSRRQDRVRSQLDEAAAQEASAAEAPAQAQAILVDAKHTAEQVLTEAREQATRERERILAEADAQVAELEQQAEETLVHEREDVLGGVRDVLLDVVARGTRQVLDEGYSAGQQREMIEAAILDSIEDLESVAIN